MPRRTRRWASASAVWTIRWAQVSGLREDGEQGLPLAVELALGQGHDDGVLAREVLVHGADGDPGPLGDPVRRSGRIAVALENLSRPVQDGLDRLPGSALRGPLAQAGAGIAQPRTPSSPIRIANLSNPSDLLQRTALVE